MVRERARFPRALAGALSLFPLWLLGAAGPLRAQDLDPRAYTVTPLDLNIAVVLYNRTWGDVLLDPSLPVEDVSARLNAYAIGYFRSINFFGRSANIRVALPYVTGHVEGLLLGEFAEADRSGIADMRAQISVNLLGGAAMTRPEFAFFKPGSNLFASFTVVAPTGQYYADKLINLGNNRWAFKPEVAFTQALGKWTLEGYAGVWFFTTNDKFYRGASVRKQDPMLTYQLHASYTFRPGLWASIDGTVYNGGDTSVDGVDKNDRQQASRAGTNLSWSFAPGHSVKVQYARTTTVRVGGKFNMLSFGYTYSWFDK
jgi:hypothetical protein